MRKVFLCISASCLLFSSLFAEEHADSLNVVNLQSVEVSATRASKKTPLTYSNMDKEKIKSLHLVQDIPYILSQTPSVVSTSDAGTGIGYSGFRIRGTDANRINITVNGVPLNDSESHGVFWVNMPDFASSLEDLQIQRGVGTSTNGAGAFGASINLKTEKIPLDHYAELNTSYGSFHTAKAALKAGTGVINDHWAFDVRLSSITSDGYIDRANVDLKSYFAQGAYFKSNALLKFVTFSGKETTYHAWNGVPASELEKGNRTYNPSGFMGRDANGNPLFYDNQTDNYQQTHYQLSLLQTLNPYLHLNAALHYTQGRGYYEEYKTKRTLSEYGLKAFTFESQTIKKSDLIRQKHLDNDFGGVVVSLNYRKDKHDITLGFSGNHYDGNHFGKVIWVKNYAGDNQYRADHEYYRNTGGKSEINTFLKANYQLSGKLNLYGDIQFRRIDYRIQGKHDTWDWINEEMQGLDIHKKFNFLNPKTGVFYQLNSRSNLYASLSIAHREPNRNNYTDAALNEKPESEHLLDYEFGYKFKSRNWEVGVNAYYMQYKNQLILNGKINEIGEALTSNIPDSYRLGIECTAGVRILPCLSWDGNLTLSKNKIKHYTEYVTIYDENGDPEAEQAADYYGTSPISFSPGVIANSLFSYHHKAWKLGFQSHYAGKQYLDNTGDETRKLDAYFVNNFRIAYTFRLKEMKQLDINFWINNIFNEQYETNGWLSASYARNVSGSLDKYVEKGYFPQAGRHFLAKLILRF